MTTDLVTAEAPDALVIAIGGESVFPDIPGVDKPHVVSAVELLRDITKYPGKKAVVIGGGDVGCETACYLADNGYETTIVEILPNLMETNIMKNVKVQMFNLLGEKNITVLTGTKATAFIDEGVEVLLPSGKLWGLEADVVAVAIGYKAEDAITPSEKMQVLTQETLAVILSMHAEEVHMIGDCVELGAIRGATESGERVGRWL